MGKNVLSIMAGVTMASAAFVACTDYSIMDDSAIYQGIVTEEYDKNFIEQYGTANPNQTWDMSSYAQYMRGIGQGQTRTTSTLWSSFLKKAITRADSDNRDDYVAGINNFSEAGYTWEAIDGSVKGVASNIMSKPTSDTPDDTWYDVAANTLTWLNDNLQERYDNRNLGKPFELVKPTADFQIIPIYQGETTLNWALHMVAKGTDGKIYDYELWRRSDDIQYHEDWIWHRLDYTLDGGQTIGKTKVKTKAMTIDHTKITDDFYFYLDIAKGNHDRDVKDWKDDPENPGHNIPNSYWQCSYTGDKLLSSQGHMLALRCPTPSNMAGKQAMIIGCEDSRLEASDHDLNDVVFLVVGESLPGVKSVVKKRYMIEDLGSTNDFDFNDIVVDVTQEQPVTFTVNSTTQRWEANYGAISQKAEIKWLCGTLPFKVTVGSTTIAENDGKPMVPETEMEGTARVPKKTNGKSGYAPNFGEKAITGWNPETNNITVQVWRNGNPESDSHTDDQVVYTIGFPNRGENAPKVIAVDQTTAWKDESVPVEDEWWKVRGLSFTETIGGQGGQGTSTVVDIDYSKLGTEYNYTVTEEYKDNNDHSKGTWPVVDLKGLFTYCSKAQGTLYFVVPAGGSFTGNIGASTNPWSDVEVDLTKIELDNVNARVYSRTLTDDVWKVARDPEAYLFKFTTYWHNDKCYLTNDKTDPKRIRIFYKADCNEIHVPYTTIADGEWDDFDYSEHITNASSANPVIDFADYFSDCEAESITMIFELPSSAQFNGKFSGKDDSGNSFLYPGTRSTSDEPALVFNNLSGSTKKFSYELTGKALQAAHNGTLKFNVYWCNWATKWTANNDDTPPIKIHYRCAKGHSHKFATVKYDVAYTGGHRWEIQGSNEWNPKNAILTFDKSIFEGCTDYLNVTISVPNGGYFSGTIGEQCTTDGDERIKTIGGNQSKTYTFSKSLIGDDGLKVYVNYYENCNLGVEGVNTDKPKVTFTFAWK